MDTIENTSLNIPVLALRGLIIFPGCVLSFDVERDISIRALERAMEQDQYVFLVAQRETATGRPEEKDLYAVGTLSVIRQILRIGEASVRVIMEGKSRARLRRLWQTELKSARCPGSRSSITTAETSSPSRGAREAYSAKLPQVWRSRASSWNSDIRARPSRRGSTLPWR